ncbi:MAG: DUF3135 domain-containing protein [Desulforhopalus sp.]
MSDSLSKEGKKREYLTEHDRLAHLFVTDRFAFEIERKRIIADTIEDICSTDECKEKMRAQQKELDRILKGSGSAENRFAMIQSLFWHHVVNEWQPALQEFQTALSSLKYDKKKRSPLSLVKK